MISQTGPTLAQLRAFRSVATYLHFGQAAQALGLSQPALSSALAGCEQALGGRLVERTTRRVMLTPLGERLLPTAVRVIDAAADLVAQSLQARRPFSGRLRLGVIPTVAPYLLPKALAMLAKRHPELDVVVSEDHTSALLDALVSGRCDLALLATPAPGLVQLPLYDEDFVLVVAPEHELAGAHDLDPQVLRTVDVLLLTQGHCLRDQAIDVCRAAGADPRSVSRAAGLTTLVQLVGAGLGATLVPESALALEAQRGQVATARFRRPAPGRRVGLVHRAVDEHAGEYATIATDLRRMVRVRRVPVQLVDPA